MATIHFHVADNTIEGINKSLSSICGVSKQLSANEIGREALAVYKWMLEQLLLGKAIVSADRNLTNLTQSHPIVHPKLASRTTKHLKHLKVISNAIRP